jgi:hypothetical protein
MITEKMQLLDIVSDFPETERVFKQYDDIIGKCLLCSNLFDTIEMVTMIYGIDKDEILEKLNSVEVI